MLQKTHRKSQLRLANSVDQYCSKCYNTHMNSKKESTVYYIIVRATGLIATDGPNKARSYKTHGAAQATRTRLCRKAGWTAGELSIVDIKDYKPRMVTRKNLMSGAEFQEDVNTPYFCSPSSETYWSM
jgi:hypothetical protein